jgi:large repetitive protein
VLIAGGRQKGTKSYVPLKSTEIYNPLNSAMAPGPTMAFARFSHRATALSDGRIVVAGGSGDTSTTVTGSLDSAEIYASGAWTVFAAPPALQQRRREFTMTRLNDDRLLAVGGLSGTLLLANSELFSPNAFTLGATMVQPPDASRSGHAASLMTDGRVLVTGGTGSGGVAISSAQLYNSPAP